MNAFPDNTPVETRFPLNQEDHRDTWPWLPGWVVTQCGPDEWQVCVQDPRLAELEDGSPAPEGTPEDEALFPLCFRDASEIRRAS